MDDWQSHNFEADAEVAHAQQLCKTSLATDCSALLSEGQTAYESGDYSLASVAFYSAYNDCSGFIKWQSRLMQAQILQLQSDYSTSINYANEVYSNSAEFSRDALKLIILGYQAQGNCDGVLSAMDDWQSHNFEADAEVERVAEFCNAWQSTADAKCDEDFSEAYSSMQEQDYIKASLLFQIVFADCTGKQKWTSRLLLAQIQFYQQNYALAVSYSEEVFLEVQGDDSFRKIAKAALGLAMQAYNALGDCEGVLKIQTWWELNGFEAEPEFVSLASFCSMPPEQVGTAGSVLSSEYFALLSTYASGDFSGTLAKGFSLYFSALKSDRSIAFNTLKQMIFADIKLSHCNNAKLHYKILSNEFGANSALKTQSESCTLTGNQQFASHVSTTTSIYASSSNTKQLIETGLTELKKKYNSGDFSGAESTAKRLLNTYFNTKNYQRLYYAEWQAISKFKLLAEFAQSSNSWICVSIYSDYRSNYFPVFGQDSQIEAAYRKCKGLNTPSNLCRTSWPTIEGPKIWLNQEVHSCNLFETGNSEIDYIVDDAAQCCDGQESSALCTFAKSHSTLSNPALNKKRCKGIYIIKALGSYAKYMKGYFKPEVNCYGKASDSEKLFSGRCLSNHFYTFNQNAKKLSCRPDRSVVWNSDTDMSRNNCNLVEPPAHASLNILKTGTCADYSVAVTTLLRKAGYSEREVFSVYQGKHITNLVKLPGDNKYHHVDTTGNRVGIVFDGSFPIYSKIDWANMKRKICVNDKGTFKCPPLSQVYETFSIISWLGDLIGGSK